MIDDIQYSADLRATLEYTLDRILNKSLSTTDILREEIHAVLWMLKFLLPDDRQAVGQRINHVKMLLEISGHYQEEPLSKEQQLEQLKKRFEISAR